jgi:hypothetical protein
MPILTSEGKQTNSKYLVSFRTVVSSGGKTMTITGKGTDSSGANVTLTLVFEKQ